MAAGNDNRTRTALTAAYGVSLLALIGAALIHDPHLWGLDWYGFLPRWSMLLLVAGGIAVFFVARWLSRRSTPPPR